MQSWPFRSRALTLASFICLLGISLSGCETTAYRECCALLARAQGLQYPLVVEATGHLGTLDPNLATDAASRTVVSLLYDGLVTLDRRLAVEDWAAQKINVDASGLIYTFYLRSGLAFADGTPITSADFAFSINRALSPCLASPAARDLAVIKDADTFSHQICVNGQIGVNTAIGQSGPVISTLIGDALQTPNEHMLVIILGRPAGYFLAALASTAFGALDPTVVGSDATGEQWTQMLDQGQAGRGTSGMFYLVEMDQRGGSIRLRSNPHWWGDAVGKKPYLTEIDFVLFTKAETAYLAYQAGQFDLVAVPPDRVAQARKLPDYHETGTLTDNALNFNRTKPPFNNLDARRAFCLAINRDLVGVDTLHDLVNPSWNVVLNGVPGFNPELTGPDDVVSTGGDAFRAQSHWSSYKAAIHGATFAPLTYLYDRDDPDAAAVARELQAQWQRALGITVVLRGERHADWQRDFDAGNYSIAPVSLEADYPDPQQFLSRPFLDAANTHVSDLPQAGALLAQADALSNQRLRLQLYQHAEQLLVDNVLTCPLYHGEQFFQIRSFVHNFEITPTGLAPLDLWAGLYVTNH